MGNGALAIGPKLPRPSSTLPNATSTTTDRLMRKAEKSSRTSCFQAVGRKEYSEQSGRAWCFHGGSGRFRRKLFHGRRYLAQNGGASRTVPCETAIGYRDGPRGTNLRPIPPLLSHKELVSSPFCHSKCT